jgi:hypothetical protein
MPDFDYAAEILLGLDSMVKETVLQSRPSLSEADITCDMDMRTSDQS